MKQLLIRILPEQFSRLIKNFYLSIRRWYYYGNNYECPVCNKKFRKMLPGGFDLEVIKEKNIIGAGLRDNNVCPYCLSTDRDRLVYVYLNNKTQIFTDKVKILHISPEPALYNNFKKRKNIMYVTGTKYSAGIYYHKDIDSVDLLELPFSEGEFDLVICNHVLEHLIDDAKAMSEIFRVVTKGGSAILQVPISNQLDVSYEDYSIVDEKQREIHFGQFDHVRIYGKDYITKLQKAGFEVQTYFPSDKKFNELNHFALNKDERLFIAHKN